jgi:hypothetical protein
LKLDCLSVSVMCVSRALNEILKIIKKSMYIYFGLSHAHARALSLLSRMKSRAYFSLTTPSHSLSLSRAHLHSTARVFNLD